MHKWELTKNTAKRAEKKCSKCDLEKEINKSKPVKIYLK